MPGLAENIYIFSDSKVKGAARVLRIVLYKRQLLVGVPERVEAWEEGRAVRRK